MLKSAFWLGKFWLGKVVVKGDLRIRWLARWLVVLQQQMFLRKKRNSSDRASIVISWFLIVPPCRRNPSPALLPHSSFSPFFPLQLGRS